MSGKRREYQRAYQQRNRERLNAYRRELYARRQAAKGAAPVVAKGPAALLWPDAERPLPFPCRSCREWTTDGTALFCRSCWQAIFEQGRAAVPAPF